MGGELSGTVGTKSFNGILLYDFVNDILALVQPPPLTGNDVAVRAIEARPWKDSTDVYIGGNFETAGSLDCPCVCVYKAAKASWERPGTGLSGSTSFMTWTSADALIVAGNLSVSNTPSPLVAYHAPQQVWTSFNVDKPLNGTITAMSQTLLPAQAIKWSSDSNTFWVAGKNHNGSIFLMKWDGADWLTAPGFFGTDSEITVLRLLSVTTGAVSNKFLSTNTVLLIGGKLHLATVGQASAVYFDGETFMPYLLTKTASGDTGTLSHFFSQAETMHTVGSRLFL